MLNIESAAFLSMLSDLLFPDSLSSDWTLRENIYEISRGIKLVRGGRSNSGLQVSIPSFTIQRGQVCIDCAEPSTREPHLREVRVIPKTMKGVQMACVITSYSKNQLKIPPPRAIFASTSFFIYLYKNGKSSKQVSKQEQAAV